MHKGKKQLNIIYGIVLTLLCAVLLTTYLTSGLYARYSTTATGSASAMVASFKIETDLDNVKLGTQQIDNLQLGITEDGNNVSIPFYIISESDVTVGYSVLIDFKKALPEYITLTLSNGSINKTLYADGEKSIFEFNEFAQLTEGSSEEQKENLLLTFSITDLSNITEEVSFTTAELVVSVYQID